MSDSSNPFGVGVVRRKITPPEEAKAGLLVVPPTVPAPELQLHCLAHREAARDFPGSNEVLFAEEDEADNDREWYEAPHVYSEKKNAETMSQAQHWQRLMSWTVLPTFAEAQQWQTSVSAAAYNSLVDRTMVFRKHYAECERLAKLGGVAWWRERMSLPAPEPGARPRNISLDDVAVWLSSADVSPVAIETWRKELEARAGSV